MRGHGYSWGKISQHLLDEFCTHNLQLLHFEAGNILYEWVVLCDERVSWQQHGGPSFQNFDFNRDCLINLTMLPTQAGMGQKGT